MFYLPYDPNQLFGHKSRNVSVWLMPLPSYLYCFTISSRPAYFLVIVLVADAIAAAAAGSKMAAAAISQTCSSQHLGRLRPDFLYSFVSDIAIASVFATESIVQKQTWPSDCFDVIVVIKINHDGLRMI